MSWYCQAGPDFVLWCAQDGGFKYWKMEFKMGSGPWQRGIHHNNIPNSTGCFLFVCFLIQMPRHGRTYLTMVLIFNGLRWRRQPGCILCGTFSLDLPKHKVERWCSCCKLAASCFATDPYGLRGFILRFQLPLPGFFINLFNTGPNGGESSKQTYSAISNAASCFFPNSQTPIKNGGFELGFTTPVVDYPCRHRSIPSLRRCFGWPGGLQRSHEDVYGHFVATEDQRWFNKGPFHEDE